MVRRIAGPAALGAAFAAMAVTAADRSLLVAFVGAVAVAGVMLWHLWRRGGRSLRMVLGLALLFRLMVLWLPPSLSDDAYRYVWDGMVQQAGINPYAYPPEDPALAAFHEEPIYDRLNSRSFYSVYPPVSQVIFWVGGWFYGYGWRVSYYFIKGLLALFEVGALLLLARMVTPRRLMLYAWNPMVVMASAGQAHTEAAMVFFLVLGVWFFRRERGEGGAAALAAAGWVKLYPFVLLPLLWPRFRLRAVWPAALVTGMLAWPYFTPAVPGHLTASLDLYVRYFEFNAGLYYGVKKVFLMATGDDWSKTLGPFFRYVFLGLLPLLYGLAWWRKWPVHRGMLVVMGAFFLCSTTVHPWYLVGVLALAMLEPRVPWHWLWLGWVSMGTYLLYVGGPYWPFVVAGWGGWALLAAAYHHDRPLQWVQRLRGRGKARRLEALLPEPEGLRVLDLGAGEGYVGAALADRGAHVHLADVLPLNRTPLPHTRYDGRRLPFDDDAFDVVVLYFVLHHCADPEGVFREALRVARDRVLVVESVYETEAERRRLTFLDTLANRLRSGGLMRKQEPHLHFRTAEGWEALFRAHGGRVTARARRGRWLHRQAFFLVRPDAG